MSYSKYIITHDKESVWAQDPVTGESSRDDTEADVVRRLEGKLYMVQVLREQGLCPLDEQEKEAFVQWLNENAMDVWLQFKKHRIIYQDDFLKIDVRIMCNHTDLIQKAFAKIGHDVKLTYCEYGNHFAIIDSGKLQNYYENLMRNRYDRP